MNAKQTFLLIIGCMCISIVSICYIAQIIHPTKMQFAAIVFIIGMCFVGVAIIDAILFQKKKKDENEKQIQSTKLKIMEDKPSQKHINTACFIYNPGCSLMSDEEYRQLQIESLQWLDAWRNSFRTDYEYIKNKWGGK